MKPADSVDTANAPTTQLSTEPVTVKRNHIDDFMQIPAFNSVLSHGVKPVLTIPKGQLDSMMALGTNTGRFIVLCLPSEYRSTGWFNLIEQGKRLKMGFAGAYTCAPDILQTVLQEHVHEKDALKAHKAQEHERETIAKII